MHTPLPNSDLDDFEPLPDVADLFDDLPEEIARQASKRERDNGKSGKTSAGSRSSMALAPTTATTTAKRARVSTRTEPTAVQTLQELHGKSCSGQTHYSFDDDDIDFELDILSHDDDHHTPVIATNKSPSAQTADRSYSTMLNEAVRQVDHILRGSGGDPFDLGLNTRASPALSQTPTGFHALPETRDEQQEHWNGSSNESLSDTLSGHCKEDEPARDQACDNAREIGTEHLDQGTEEQPPGNVTGETSSTDPPAPAYSFMTPTSVNELEERLHGLSQLLCSTFDEIVVSVRGVEDLRSSIKEATDAHFLALDIRDGRIQARKAEVQAAATSIQSRGPVDFSSPTR
ncbi:hypothetical protein BG003_008656 [Podila horticola]|nr:hypothetical protein BG003_008656 [Podila horticola]